MSYRFADSLRAGSGRKTTSILILLANCQQNCMTYTIAVYTVKNSWWWTEELFETYRVFFQKFIWEISASSWFYYKNCNWFSYKSMCCSKNSFVTHCTILYTHTQTHTHTHTHIYIYSVCLYVCICVYIYIYIYLNICRLAGLYINWPTAYYVRLMNQR